MDDEILVETQIEDGRSLIDQLVDDGLDVTVAFWAQRSDGHIWSLYIGTRSLETLGNEAWSVLYASMRRLDECSLSLADVHLFEAASPLAQAALSARRRTRDGMLIRHPGPVLDRLDIVEAYIYPKVAGPMGRDLVAHRVAGLMAQDGGDSSALFSLRDGTRFLGTPLGLSRTTPGVLMVDARDLDADRDRSISADEIIAIRNRRREPHEVDAMSPTAGRNGPAS